MIMIFEFLSFLTIAGKTCGYDIHSDLNASYNIARGYSLFE